MRIGCCSEVPPRRHGEILHSGRYPHHIAGGVPRIGASIIVIAMLAYVIAGPDGTRQDALREAQSPA